MPPADGDGRVAALESGNARLACELSNAQVAGLPAQYAMHTAVRVYHTTRSDLADDDPSWRDLRRSCDVAVNLNVDRTCGEEIYFPLDVPMLLTSPLHPALLAHLLSLATEDRVRGLLRILFGAPADAVIGALGLVPTLAVAAAALLLAICAACCAACRCACRRCRGWRARAVAARTSAAQLAEQRKAERSGLLDDSS